MQAQELRDTETRVLAAAFPKVRFSGRDLMHAVRALLSKLIEEAVSYKDQLSALA